MKSIALAGVVVAALLSGGSAFAQSPSGSVSASASVTITWSIDNTIKYLGSGIDYLIKLYQSSADQDTKSSVARLSLELTNLASREEGLARELDFYSVQSDRARTVSSRTTDPELNSLNKQIDDIRDSFARVNNLAERLDPNWAAAHSTIKIDIGTFARDSVLYYIGPAGSGAFFLNNRNVTSSLSGFLRADGRLIRSYCDRLHRAGVE